MIDLLCPDEARRDRFRASTGPLPHAIDHIEVLPSQRALLVHAFAELPATLGPDDVAIDGGVRVTPIRVTAAARADLIPAGTLVASDQVVVDALSLPDRRAALAVRTDSSGDFSTYTLRLVRAGRQRERLRPDPVERRVLVQGRLPQRLRLRPGSGVSAAALRGGAHRLPREGLRQLPRAMLDRLSRDDAGVDGPQPGRPRRDAGRGARLRSRPPVVPPGRRRDRGLSRHGPPTLLGPAPCPSARLPLPRRRQRPGLDRGDGGRGRRRHGPPGGYRHRPGRRPARHEPARARGCCRTGHARLRSPPRHDAAHRSQRDRHPRLGRPGVLPAARRDDGHPARVAGHAGARARRRAAVRGAPRLRRPGHQRRPDPPPRGAAGRGARARPRPA